MNAYGFEEVLREVKKPEQKLYSIYVSNTSSLKTVYGKISQRILC